MAADILNLGGHILDSVVEAKNPVLAVQDFQIRAGKSREAQNPELGAFFHHLFCLENEDVWGAKKQRRGDPVLVLADVRPKSTSMAVFYAAITGRWVARIRLWQSTRHVSQRQVDGVYSP